MECLCNNIDNMVLMNCTLNNIQISWTCTAVKDIEKIQIEGRFSHIKYKNTIHIYKASDLTWICVISIGEENPTFYTIRINSIDRLQITTDENRQHYLILGLTGHIESISTLE